MATSRADRRKSYIISWRPYDHLGDYFRLSTGKFFPSSSGWYLRLLRNIAIAPDTLYDGKLSLVAIESL